MTGHLARLIVIAAFLLLAVLFWWAVRRFESNENKSAASHPSPSTKSTAIPSKSIFAPFFTKSPTDPFRILVEQSEEDLKLKTAAHNATWHLVDADWAVDQDTGKIVFTQRDGTTATCPVQIIGTYNTADGTWLWGWDHPSVQPPLDEHARKLRAYGQEHGIAPLTTRKLHCTEADAWDFAALACKLNDAEGAYRGPSGPTRVFMTFGNVTLSKPSAARAAGQ